MSGEGGPDVGHQLLCRVNPGERDAAVRLALHFADRAPVQDSRLAVEAGRRCSLRPDLLGGFAWPREVPYAARSRRDVTQPNATLITCLDFAVEAPS